MKLVPIILFLVGGIVGCSSTVGNSRNLSGILPETLEEAVNSSYRTPANKTRDKYRHPIETLKFFGIKPEMSVVEITPGGGWYTEILAPYLIRRGKYYAALPPGASNIRAWLDKYPEIKEGTTITYFSPPEDIAPEGSVDMVLTFRNVHNWMAAGNADVAFQAFYKALKPGGVLGVVEHRANADSKYDPKASTGYVREEDVIKMAEKAGFKLAARSEINANPKDKKNYPKGVWTLPPTLQLRDKGREVYLKIGESDRMTLRFFKPFDAFEPTTFTWVKR